MQTLAYLGSKKKLQGTLYYIINSNIENLHSRCFADLFAGTGIISFGIQNKVKSVTACDLEYYSYVINSALLKVNYTKKLKHIIKKLNSEISDISDTFDTSESPEEIELGLIERHFSPSGTEGRLFFTSLNARMADHCRQRIREKYMDKTITRGDKLFLLASLLTSIDRVSNTSCVYCFF